MNHCQPYCCRCVACAATSLPLRASQLFSELLHSGSSIQLVWDRDKRGTAQREGRLTETWKSSPKKTGRFSRKTKRKQEEEEKNLKWTFGTLTPGVKGSHDGNMKTVVQHCTEKQLRWLCWASDYAVWLCLLSFLFVYNLYLFLSLSMCLSVSLSICLPACLPALI